MKRTSKKRKKNTRSSKKSKAKLGTTPEVPSLSKENVELSSHDRTSSGNPLSRYHKRVAHHKGKVHIHFDLAGIESTPQQVRRKIMHISVLITILFSLFLLYRFIVSKHISLLYGLLIVFITWTVVFAGVLLLVWLVFFIFVDLRIMRRRQVVEEVLPEFLQLTAANIRAGMSIDRAMWFAMRPKFGVFAAEIENVAKSTISGDDFNKALLVFAEKYRSPIVARSMHLLIEGIDAGGEVADLLNRIAEDISDLRLLRKDMAASVTTYVIFISVAAVLAAPVLFALSTQLLGVVTTLSNSLDVGSTSQVGFSFSSVAVDQIDFQIFSVVALGVTSFFAACIVAIVKKGAVKLGLRYIPLFVLCAIGLYLALNHFLGGVFANIISVA